MVLHGHSTRTLNVGSAILMINFTRDENIPKYSIGIALLSTEPRRLSTIDRTGSCSEYV